MVSHENIGKDLTFVTQILDYLNIKAFIGCIKQPVMANFLGGGLIMVFNNNS